MLDSISTLRHTVAVGRLPGSSMKSKNSLGTDACQVVLGILGAFDVALEAETPDVALVSYVWRGTEPFMGTAQHLAAFGLRRVDWL